MIEYNTFNKGKGKMKGGKRTNKKTKKNKKEVYSQKHVRKVEMIIKTQKLKNRGQKEEKKRCLHSKAK